MDIDRRTALKGAAGALLGCTGLTLAGGSALAAGSGYPLELSAREWQHDESHDVYYQLGKYYVAHPQAKAYENLGIYVPGKYVKASKNASGRYTVKISGSGRVNGFTAATAPIVIPVNTPGYAAQQPPTSYSYEDVSAYLEAGFIYVWPGLRGRDSETSTYYGNAPWGVTDLKAAIRYLRYNADVIPGSTDRIFVFGMSGGGAQTAVAGASGDSSLYNPYLKALGAAFTDADGGKLSDAIAGAMCWCPITSLDMANASYEWNMGQFSSAGTRAHGNWTKAYSNDLADAWAAYVNRLALKSSAGDTLSLKASRSGLYLAGSYYDNLIEVINTSLNDFLSYTKFPYTQSTMGAGGGPPSGGAAPSGSGQGGAPSGSSGKPPSGGSGKPPSGGSGQGGAPSGSSGKPPSGASGSGSSGGAPSGAGGAGSSKTFKTVAKYFEYLNSSSHWVGYDAAKKTANVLNLGGFVNSQKQPSKPAGAFDGYSREQTENLVFGHGNDPLHFAPVSRELIAANQSRYARLKDWESSYGVSAYNGDFAKHDSIGYDQLYRGHMYNPMYYLSDYYDGYRSGTVAPHWRIRTGIMQGDTANTTEINLALALANLGIKNVDFATVWGEGHTMAETTGQPTTNFINWVKRSIG